jgi:hypothetical protein
MSLADIVFFVFTNIIDGNRCHHHRTLNNGMMLRASLFRVGRKFDTLHVAVAHL